MIAGVTRLLPDQPFMRASALQFGVNSVGRFLSLLFSVAAARMLPTAGFGQLTFAIAVASSVSIVVANASRGLSRFLTRYQDDRPRQSAYFSNWMVVVALALATNMILLVLIAVIFRFDGPILLGVAVNVVGIGVFQAYRETQRGLGRFGTMALYYLLANLLQLVAILVAGLLGQRSAALFLVVYGLSSVGALVIQAAAPLAVRFTPRAVAWSRIAGIVRFIRPLAFQTVFYAIWSNADVILVGWLLGSTATGNYGAAKTTVAVLYLIPLAVSVVAGPAAVRLQGRRLREFVAGAVALTAVGNIFGSVVLVFFRRSIVSIGFSDKYIHASDPMILLVIGMSCYGLFMVLEAIWVGLGRPRVTALASGLAVAGTVLSGPPLIAAFGITGAAIAYVIGSALQLAVIGAFSVRSLVKDRQEPVTAYADGNLFL